MLVCRLRGGATAFLAHADKDHLHHLAPERRATVLKLLERFAVNHE
ncbi:MAG: hypothetical protein NTV46_19685 [Verrucomicrobia bacterium]|nr:hypothetical protein [Verrucomicrobiota bacterium]